MAENTNNEGGDKSGSGGGNDPQERNWRQLEEARDNAVAEAETYKRERDALADIALQGVAHRAGFDVDGEGSGVVKLVLEKYREGEITPDRLNPEKFSEFAQQFDVQPNRVIGDQTTETTTGGDASDRVEQFQQQASQLSNLATTPQGPPSTQAEQLQAQIAEAEQKGDWGTAANLKFQLAQALDT